MSVPRTLTAVITTALTLLDPTTATAQEGTHSPQMDARAKVLRDETIPREFQ